MAGDWIKWTKGLTKRREVVAMAEALSLDRRIIAASCMEVWEWADENTEDGNAHCVSKTFVDAHIGVIGFADAMEKTGWLIVSEAGISFPRFERHNGQTAKQRALTKSRVGKHKRKRKGNATSVTRSSLLSSTPTDSDSSSLIRSPSEKTKGPFDRFWDAYPKHVGKDAAREAFKRARKRADVEAVIAAAVAFGQSPKGKGAFCPHPATWLNQGRWQDDPATWQDSGDDKHAKQPRTFSPGTTYQPGATGFGDW